MGVDRAGDVACLVGALARARVCEVESAVDERQRRIAEVRGQDRRFDEGFEAHRLPCYREIGRSAARRPRLGRRRLYQYDQALMPMRRLVTAALLAVGLSAVAAAQTKPQGVMYRSPGGTTLR